MNCLTAQFHAPRPQWIAIANFSRCSDKILRTDGLGVSLRRDLAIFLIRISGFVYYVVGLQTNYALRAMAAVLDHFSDRLNAGAKSDLLALTEITFIKSRTARVFYENGFETVAAVANADPKELVPILIQVRDDNFRNHPGGSTNYTKQEG